MKPFPRLLHRYQQSPASLSGVSIHVGACLQTLAGCWSSYHPRHCRSSSSALLSAKYEKLSSKVAAMPNPTPTNSAAPPPTDHDNVAPRPHTKPPGRQTQAIRRLRISTAEARKGLFFVLHHIGYRIPMLMPNETTAINILRGESPT